MPERLLASRSSLVRGGIPRRILPDIDLTLRAGPSKRSIRMSPERLAPDVSP